MTEQPGPRVPWDRLEERMDELKAVIPALADLPTLGPESVSLVVTRLAQTAEALQRRGIRDRIELRSFQEMVETLLRGGDASILLRTLTHYLLRVSELGDLLCLRRLPDGRWSGSYASARRPDPIDVNLDSLEAPLPAGVPPLASFAIGSPLSATGEAAPAQAGADCLGMVALNPGHDPDPSRFDPGELYGRVGVILETLRHREEREAADRFRRQLVGAMGDGLLAVDRAEEILDANAAAARLLGEDVLGLRGASLSDLAHAETLVSALRLALGRKEAPPPHEILLSGPCGAVPVNLACSAWEDESGAFGGLVVNLTDLSPLRAMEEEIRRLDHLAALGRFAAGVAHEVRNPLAGIEAGVQYIGRRFPPGAPEHEDLKFVTGEVRRLNRIVSDLLDYTRPRPLDPCEVEASKLAQRVRHALEPHLRARDVHLELSGETPLVFTADAERLSQVLLNLTKNAVEASQPGGAVLLRWETRPGSMSFVVEDRGEGMTEEERARAFEPFFTTKGAGTGLGLYLSHAIVQQHGGRLSLAPRSGGGTAAKVELPLQRGRKEKEHDAILHSDR